MSRFWKAFILLIVLNLIDASLTALLVSHYGIEAELNPLQYYMLSVFGIAGLYIFKGVVLAAAAITFYYSSEQLREKYTIGINTLNLILGSVIAWSLYCYFSINT